MAPWHFNLPTELLVWSFRDRVSVIDVLYRKGNLLPMLSFVNSLELPMLRQLGRGRLKHRDLVILPGDGR